jgi:hypothetical protein
MIIYRTVFNNTVGGMVNFSINKLGDRRTFFILLRAAILFFFGLCLFSLFLYAAGTRQGFTDETQMLLLGLSRVLGLILSICSVLGLVFCALLLIGGGRLRLVLRMGAYLLLCIFGMAVELAVSFILAVAGGTA